MRTEVQEAARSLVRRANLCTNLKSAIESLDAANESNEAEMNGFLTEAEELEVRKALRFLKTLHGRTNALLQDDTGY